MQRILFTALFFPLALLLQGQSPVKSTHQLSNAYDIGTAIHPAPNGFYIFGNLRPGGNGSPYDIFRLHVDDQGNQVSLLKFGTSGVSESIGSGVLALSDGWLLAGEKAGKGYLLRLNNSGTTLWTKEVPGAGPFADAAALPGGGWVATGKLAGKMFLARLSADGSPEWVKSYNSTNGVGLTVSAGGGNCFVVGENKISKIRLTDGSLLWEKTIVPPSYGPDGGFQTLQFRDITAAGPGQFAVTGAYVNDQIFSLYSAYYVAMWKESGEMVWEKYYKGTQSGLDVNESNSLYYMPNSGNILVAGTESGEASAVRINASGRAVDSVALGIDGYNILPVITKSGSYYAITGAALGGFQNMNTFFYRSGGNALRSDEEAEKNTDWTIAPNPASGLVILQFEYPQEQTLRVHVSDVAGRVVLQSDEPVAAGFNQISLDVSRLPAGMYWVNLPGLSPRALLKH